MTLAIKNTTSPRNDIPSTDVREGWQASLNLAFSSTAKKTILSHREQRGPLAVQRPLYPEGAICHCYLLHPPGGVVGGDTLSINVDVKSNAHALITTPGATKFYASQQPTATQHIHLKVENGSTLEWFPLENIFFSGAIARLNTRIDIDDDAQFMGWEMHCFGRPALKEGFLTGKLSGKTQIFINNKPILIEGLNYNYDKNLFFNNGLLKFPTIGTLYIHGAPKETIKLVQGLLLSLKDEQHGQTDDLVIAVTQLDNLLVVRALGPRSES